MLTYCTLMRNPLLSMHAGFALPQRRLMAPKAWIPSLLWNPNVPDPVDFRGRKLDRHTGKPVAASEEHH